MFNKLETVVFQVTTKCPYQCPQCYMERGDKQLSLDFAKDVIDYAYENQAKAIQITGGEPVLYENLSDLLKYASSKGMYSFLATSGYGATADYYNELKRNGLTILCVSINNIIEEDNAKSRDAYSEGISAIKIAIDCGICCFANVVVSDENIGGLELLGERLSDLGVQRIALLRPVPSFDGGYIPKISDSTIKLISEIVKRHSELFFVEKCFGEYWNYENKSGFACEDFGKTTFFVNADSTFSFCSKKTDKRFKSVEEMKQYKDFEKLRCSIASDCLI